MNFSLNLPINSLSMGQVSSNILFEIYKRGLQPCIFPIGQTDISCYNYFTDDFKSWLQSCIAKTPKTHKRTHPLFKVWHLRPDSIGGPSYKQAMLTYHETDRLTATETNIGNSSDIIFVNSEYTKSVFEKSLEVPVQKLAFGFDSNSFRVLNKKYFDDNVISFGLAGKLENRKATLDVLKLWAERYGNNRAFFLNCAIFNHFLNEEQHGSLIQQALQGKSYYNINFAPFMARNDVYNDYLNSNTAILAMSRSECIGLPEFQSVALGKHSLTFNHNGYKEWANANNSVLVQPTGSSECYDNIFFRKGDEYSQGEFATWTKEDFYAGMDSLIKRIYANKLNTAGLELQTKFLWKNTVDNILNILETLI